MKKVVFGIIIMILFTSCQKNTTAVNFDEKQKYIEIVKNSSWEKNTSVDEIVNQLGGITGKISWSEADITEKDTIPVISLIKEKSKVKIVLAEIEKTSRNNKNYDLKLIFLCNSETKIAELIGKEENGNVITEKDYFWFKKYIDGDLNENNGLSDQVRKYSEYFDIGRWAQTALFSGADPSELEKIEDGK
jgi:hypothetical protein